MKTQLGIKPWIIQYSNLFAVLALQYHVRLLFSSRSSDIAVRCSWRPFTLLAESLTVKGSAVSARIVCSVLSLHFFYPGHVPVPRRSTLQLPEWVAFCMKRRIQGTEGGGWRREVLNTEEGDMLTCISIWSEVSLLRQKPFCPHRSLQNK